MVFSLYKFNRFPAPSIIDRISFTLERTADIRTKKALVLLSKNKYKASSLAIKKALRYKPNSDFAYYILARISQKLEKGMFSENVITNYKHAIYLNPQYSFYYYYLSKYYFSFQMNDEGRKYYLKALEFYPGRKNLISE